jgi:hypothetical protein
MAFVTMRKGIAGCEATDLKNQKRIHWNTLRIFQAGDAGRCGSFAAVERLLSDRLLG